MQLKKSTDQPTTFIDRIKNAVPETICEKTDSLKKKLITTFKKRKFE